MKWNKGPTNETKAMLPLYFDEQKKKILVGINDVHLLHYLC